MRVFVTGIDGFVGSHMAELLASLTGVDLYGTIQTREPGPNLAGVNGRLRLRQADILNAGRIEELFHDIRPERVVHLAGQAFVPTAVADPVGTIQTNIAGSLSVIEAARKLRDREGIDVQVLVISSSEVYGRVAPDQLPITETVPLNPGNPYASSKASIDLIAQTYRKTYDLPVIVARPFNHVGPRQAPSFVCSEFGRKFAEFSAGSAKPQLRLGNLEARRDFTDVRDVVRAYWAILEHPGEHAVYNVCSGTAVSIREVITLYEDITGIAVDVAIEQAKVRPYDVPVLLGSAARLREATGWIPTHTLRETLTDVFQYWQRMLAAGA
jgi:GDP-4-dehydro-6-deoxy-D-mannose reductase